MSTTADNISRIAEPEGARDSAPDLGQGFVIAWSCIRRRRDADGERLEHAKFHIAIQPIDAQHGVIEAWLESDGRLVGTALSPVTHRMTSSVHGGLVHVDIADVDNVCLLSLTLTRMDHRVVYARSSLVAEGGLIGGTYDPPVSQMLHSAAAAARSA
jgi:hypothetical protein